jgi:hypothetical protein
MPACANHFSSCRHWRTTRRTPALVMAGALGAVLLLAACASRPSEPEAPTGASPPTPVGASAFSLPASAIFAPTAATSRIKTYAITDGSDRGGTVIREISPADADGSWTITTTIQTPKAATRTQVLRLAPTATGGVAMQSLADLVKETVATFDPPLVLAPPVLATGPAHTADSIITLTSSKDGKPLDSGKARASGLLQRGDVHATDDATFTLEILFELSSVDVRREAVYTLRGGQVTGEAESRTVKFGILTVERSRRVITLMP